MSSQIPPLSILRPARLIRTKLLVPPARPELVARPRLLDQLDLSLNKPVTVISAPAGFGKTTLLSAWLERRAAPAAWLALDDHDNDPARFGAYLLAALQTLEYNFPDPGPLTASALAAALLDLVNVIADLPDDLVLVLDDFHVLRAPEILAALARFIERLPAQLHLVLAAGTDPAGLPLAQLRARGQLLELRAADLRFTDAEAHAFLEQTLGLDLNAAARAALVARAEGWPAGLQLAALAAGPGGPAGEPFTGGHRYVVDYLAEQVLHRQPPGVQRFLLETSILDRLTGPLCEDLLALPPGAEPGRPAALILDELERANLFLEALDGQRQWYRYQGLFADFLRLRLRQTAPERIAGLHRRAAEWLERNGYLPESVDHALAAGDAEAAARLVEQLAEASWRQGEMIRLLHWLEALPEALVRGRPRLAIFHAWILNILGQAEATERRLRDTEAALEALMDPAEAGLLRGMLAATRAILCIMSDDAAGARVLSEQALADLPADNYVWRCVVTRNQGNADWLLGQTDRAEAALTEAFSLAQAADNAYMALVALYELGELLVVRGQLRRAADTFRRGLALAEARAAPGMTMPGAVHAGLSAVLFEWNDLEAARRHARLGLEQGQLGRSLGVQVCAATRLGLIEEARGDTAAAEAAFRLARELTPAALPRRTSFIAHHDVQAQLGNHQPDAGLTAAFFRVRQLDGTTPATYLNEAGLLALARWQLTAGRPEAALAVLHRLRPAAEAGQRWGRVVEARVLEAQAERARQQPDAARAALEAALALAEPEGYHRVFLEAGFGLEVQRGRRADSAPAAALREPLSTRELEVLGLIAAGLSTTAIAEKLVVAPSTIQTHLKHLYDKLDVHSRTQAVARARTWGLLG